MLKWYSHHSSFLSVKCTYTIRWRTIQGWMQCEKRKDESLRPSIGWLKNVLSFKKIIVNHLIFTKRTVISHLNWARWIQKDHEIWGWKCTFGLEQPQTCCGVKPVDGIPILPFGYLDLQWQCINKQTMKTLHISASTKKLHIITKKNDNISIDSTLAGSMNARS
jgi:hypothetical protein